MTDYFNSADKWLQTEHTSGGKTEQIIQIQTTTFNKQEFGPAVGVDVEEPSNRPKFAVPEEPTTTADTVRNAGTTVGQMNNDVIMESTMIYPNERQVTEFETYDSNIKPGIDKLTLVSRR